MSDSKVTPAWNFKGMLMENNSRVITNADATLTQKIYDYGEVSPEQSSVTVVKDDDMAHFYFNICSEKGEPAYIKITKDDDGNIVIIGTDHSGSTQQTLLASKIELTENDKGVLISVLATENGELIKKEAQVYDSTISVEEKDYGALVTMTNSKGTSSEAKLYSPTISAERLEDNTGVKIIITSGKEGATPTVVNLYDPIVTGKRVTGGAEITIQNHIDEEPKIINLYDAGSASIAPEYDETQGYKKFNYCIYNNTMYVCLEDTTGPFDETKWKETKVSYELDNVSLKIVAEDWDGNKTYSIGDYVMYDKILYKCISNEEGSETAYPNITTSKWETVFIMDEIPDVATTEKAGIIKVGNNLTIEEDGTLSANADLSIVAEEWDNQKQYNTGDYVIYDNILYKCITDEQGWTLEYNNPNPDYTWTTASEAICNLGGRVFYKTNDEVAYGGWNIRPDGWANPMLVATSESAVAYSPYGPVNTTVEILGTTFYLTYGSNGSMKNRSSGGRALEIPYYENYTEQTIEILKLANVYVVSDKPGPNSDKWEKVLVMDEIKNKQSTVPIASTETAGIVKVGKNLEITEDGTLNAKAGGGNANEMELTWAEYLALTDEEKNNGTTYYITDKNPTSSEKGFKSTLLATLNDQPQEIDFSNYDLILYQAYNSEVNLYSSAVFMPSFINRAGNIILSIDVTDRIIIDSTNAITLNAFNCAIDVYGMNFIGSGGELPDNIAYITNSSETKEVDIVNNTPFKFGIDEDGNYGYYKKGEDKITPFSALPSVTMRLIGIISKSSEYEAIDDSIMTYKSNWHDGVTMNILNPNVTLAIFIKPGYGSIATQKSGEPGGKWVTPAYMVGTHTDSDGYIFWKTIDLSPWEGYESDNSISFCQRESNQTLYCHLYEVDSKKAKYITPTVGEYIFT